MDAPRPVENGVDYSGNYSGRPPGRCRHCPRAAGLACEGESTPRLCELVDPAGPDYRPAYLAALEPAGDAGPPPAPPPIPLAVALAANRRGLLNCPDGEEPSCSCEGSAWCRRRSALVTLRDCADCLGLTDPPASAI